LTYLQIAWLRIRGRRR